MNILVQFPITFILVNISTPKVDNFAVLALCKMKVSAELCRAMQRIVLHGWVDLGSTLLTCTFFCEKYCQNEVIS